MANNSQGVLFSQGATANTVGGTVSGAGNTIAFNAAAGVLVGTSITGTESQDAILGNLIFANGALGIDLGDDGVTMNTPGGPHTGPNVLQNFPVITSATVSNGNVTLGGTFNSNVITTFTLQFFANGTADPSGYGQGQILLGQTTVTTDSSGNATFNATFAAPAGGQAAYTATATDPNGNTSEFSLAYVPANLVVTNTNDSGSGSLRAAMLYANTLSGLQTITFNIPSTGVQTIQVMTPLPAITNPVVIDGMSQPGYAGTPLIVIDGALFFNSGSGDFGLDISTGGGGSTIDGLSIVNFQNGATMEPESSSPTPTTPFSTTISASLRTESRLWPMTLGSWSSHRGTPSAVRRRPWAMSSRGIPRA